jgi:hypothetical protein
MGVVVRSSLDAIGGAARAAGSRAFVPIAKVDTQASSLRRQLLLFIR